MPVLQVAIDASKATTGAQQFVNATTSMTAGATNANQSLTTLHGGLVAVERGGNAAIRTITGLTGALLAMKVFRDSVNAASQFSKEMAMLAGVTRGTEREMAQLETAARDFGSSTIYNATESAKALRILAQAGLNSSEAISALPAVFDLAAAGAVSTDEAAATLIQTLRQFNSKASESTHLVDVLVTSVNETKTDIRELAQALAFAGSAAGIMGISAEETAAAVGILSDRGVEATIAGTNVRGIIAELAGATQRTKEVLADMGLTIEEVVPLGRDLADTFEILTKAGMGAEEAVRLFDKRNFQAALVLAENTNRLRELTKANKELTDVASGNASFIENSLWGSLKKLLAVLNEVVLKTGDTGLVGSFKEMVDFTSDVVREFFGMSNGLERVNLGATILAETLKFLALAFVGVKIAAFGAAIVEVIADVTALKFALIGLYTTISTNPLGLMAVALAGAVTGYGLLQRAIKNATREQKDFGEATRLAAETLDWFERVQGKAARAGEIADYRGQASQLSQLAAALEEVRLEINQGKSEFLDPWGSVKVEPILGLLENEEAIAQIESTRDRLRKAITQTSVQYTDESPLAGLNQQFEQELKLATISAEQAVAIIDQELASLQGRIDNLLATANNADVEAQRQTSADRLQELIGLIREERSLIGLSNDERDVEVATRKAQKQAIEDEITLTDEQLRLMGDEIRENQRLQKIEDDRLETLEKARQKREDEQTARKEAISSLDDLLRRSNEELQLLRVEGEERAVLAVTIQAENAARGQNIENLGETIALLQDMAREQEKLRVASEARREAEAEAERAAEEAARKTEQRREKIADLRVEIEQYALAMMYERSLLEKTTDERERARDAAKMHTKVAQLERMEIAEFGSTLVNTSEIMKEYIKQQEELAHAEEVREMFEDMGNAVGEAFESMIFDAKSFRDAMESMIKDIARLVFQQLVTQQIASAIGGFGFANFGGAFGAANGAAFSSGRVIPFDTGGVVVDRPSYFPIRGGMGVAGERYREEGIFPLTRTPSGDLGIQTSGGGGGASVYFHVETKDAKSFEFEETQLVRRAKRAFGGR